MGWVQKLYDTYENCSSLVGVPGSGEKPNTLLPIAHSTQNAQIEVVIDGKGKFVRARTVSKDEAVTIIPVNEDSAARGNGNNPHALCDKLQYVAGDYSNYVKKDKSEEFFQKYMKQLEGWCSSPYSNEKVHSVFTYLKNNSLISDLIAYKILTSDKDGLLAKGVKIEGVAQADAFVRFRVEVPGDDKSALWLDPKVYKSYIDYYLSLQKDRNLCYVKGEEIPCSEKHPAKVRYASDKAKLISANDDSGFTYRGRFSDKAQTVNIGYETTQKAHNALRWLIENQGYRNGEQVIVAWGTQNQNIPKILEDTQDSLFGQEEAPVISTHQDYARRLNKAIAGYGYDLDTKSEIVIMGLDAATTGRLSITYYRELNGKDFLGRIEQWHKSCSWVHRYKRVLDGVDEKGKQKYKNVTFIGAPSPKDIAVIAFGSPRVDPKTGKKELKIGDALLKSTVERLLPCIIDSTKIPYDIVHSAVIRASSPVSMESWEWEKSLSIACALVRKYRYDRFKEEWEMSLDEGQMDRSYLFGRLLAVAQQLEEWALNTTGEKRETNAERLMHQFKLHPYKTWGILTDKLRPYISRLGSQGNNLVELMTKINSMLSYEDFTSSKQLNDSYILGYYCQRQVFIDEKNQRMQEKQKRKLQGEGNSHE